MLADEHAKTLSIAKMVTNNGDNEAIINTAAIARLRSNPGVQNHNASILIKKTDNVDE